MLQLFFSWSNFFKKLVASLVLVASLFASSLSLQQVKVRAEGDKSFYDTYSQAMPASCGGVNVALAKGVNDADLIQVGTIYGQKLFKLKDENHQLYEQQYETKVLGVATFKDPQNGKISYKQWNNQTQQYEIKTLDSTNYTNPQIGKSSFEEMNKIKPPSLAEYKKANPLLFFKDFFGRFMMVGEYQYKIAGGCGKPVIYFYPTQETEIKAKFNSKIQFDVQIPSYDEKEGWNVKAKPNGELTDLQPNLTNCQEFENPNFGQEYAKEACKNNKYPYIYWAGRSMDREYLAEISKRGWIVKKEGLEKVLTQKLDFIGLNKKEIADFLEYWLPKLNAQNKPFYRLSFLQNPELNKLFPMTISPKPDSAIRVFLDWEGLDNQTQISPQNLTQYQRNGFVMVEWGGLKK